ncbi:hypothetical protein Zm00014a_024814 [Zea mays]|uniref:Myosin heavy chain-related protein n=1 Tax=Zea mays TaxID=4577 RepID=A0A3L6D6R6_MAIZE|nr:hypothetical protein Zm00014a_024814 [Zea mays]
MIDQDIPTNALSAQEDAEWERKMSLKEDEIIALREKLDRVLSIENPGGVGSDAIYLELEKENDFLKVKMQDLENDCSELTEENLELIHKLKEVSGVEEQDSCLSDIEVMLNATGLSGTSKSRAKYLERKCADLEQKMLNFQSESRELEEKLKKSHEDLKGQTLELSELRENLSRFRAMELERGEINFSRGYQLRSEELGDIETELKLLKSTVQLKEKEIEGLQHSKLEMETFIDSVLGPKIHELEIYKVELELHISRLEDEKIELLESISGMEVELTNLTSEYESCIVQMDDSRTMIIDLKDKVERNQMELEAQKVELKKKQLEFQKIFLEAQDDSEALRRLNAKLQAKKDISLKEQSFLLELDNIFHEHKDHEEKINRAHFLLNKIDKEKAIEIENLEREVISLTAQLSSTHGEQASSMVDTIREASILRADKAKLQANLHDVNEQLRHYESLLEDIHKESKRKIKSLTDSLNVSKQNEEMLKIDAEAVRRLMEAAKSNEENLRITSNELELKYKSSDYEKQQIMEENYGLKIQVRKIAGVQDELLEVQSSLDEAQFEKERLEGILRLISEECDELKVQNAMLTDKVSMMQDTSNNIIEEKQTKTSMQTKMSTINEGNNDLATDNRGCCLVNEEPDLQVKVQSLEADLPKF